MASDSNAPPAPAQDPPVQSATERLIWSTCYSQPLDIKIDCENSLDFFRLWRPKRERRKQGSKTPDSYLSRAEAAEHLGVSVRFLEGDTTIPKVNVARPGAKRATWRYCKKDLDDWASARTTATKRGTD